MNLISYLKDKAVLLLVNGTGLLLLSLYLIPAGCTSTDIILIDFLWIAILCCCILIDFYHRRKYLDHLFSLLEEMDQRYLISEVMEPSHRLEDRLYRELLRKSNKSVIEKIHSLEDAQKEYKEYIEQWIHQVKLPLTAAKLICENRPSEENKRLLLELGKIEKQVEQALFYARMEHAYQDYLIHPVNLCETVVAAIAGNKSYFIQKSMRIDLQLKEDQPVYVSTDEKWVVFLLNQIFSNCIKYCPRENPLIRIYTEQGSQKVSLVIEDNGMGIAREDLPRIFDKGFTGRNGRTEREKSTGIGLYLCKNLCDKLGIGIACESDGSSFTRIRLTFPDSDFQNLSKM